MRVETSNLRKKTLPTLSSAKTNLENAYNCFKDIPMPENFSKASQLNAIQGRIEEVTKAVNSLSSHITNTSNDFDKAKRKAKELADKLLDALSGIKGELGNAIGGLIQPEDTSNTANKDTIPDYMLNNPDYEYYKGTQAKVTDNKPTIFPFSDTETEKQYAGTMAKQKKGFWSFLKDKAKDVKDRLLGGFQITVYAEEVENGDKSALDVDNYIQFINPGHGEGQEPETSIQTIAYDKTEKTVFATVLKKVDGEEILTLDKCDPGAEKDNNGIARREVVLELTKTEGLEKIDTHR